MNFANAASNYSNFTTTENGATALKTTGNSLVDLFASAGALRSRTDTYINTVFENALIEDKLLATKLMFYTRNIRGGLGERKTFRTMLKHLAMSDPDVVIKNIKLIPFFGRWDDLYTLEGTPAEEEMWDLIRMQWLDDVAGVLGNKSISLMAKWLKSVNTSSGESRRLGKKTAKALGVSDSYYRKSLSTLREHIDIVEKRMSSNKWNTINYENVPSNAMKNYKDAFVKHDELGFNSFIENVKEGKAKINASTLYPYDILMKAGLNNDSYHYTNTSFSFFLPKYDETIEQLWKALPNYVSGKNNILVMADTSGSMEMSANGRPLATAIGLAIYFAERNEGAYKNLFMTFSQDPNFVKLTGKTLLEKVRGIESIVANTNLEKAFQLILDLAITEHVPQEEMPKSLIIISDMQFDEANQGYYVKQGRFVKETFYTEMRQLFEEAGYKIPTIIFWNVDERRETFQVSDKIENTTLVSGQSPSVFKSILGNIGNTPYEFMVETLNDPIYDCVKI